MKKRKLKIGIIGCGVIGSALARSIAKDFQEHASLTYLCELDRNKALRLKWYFKSRICLTSIPHLIEKSDVVIEAASAGVASEVVRLALKKHKQILVLSSAGILGDTRLPDILKKSRGRLWIPSGAIAGIDGLLAAREAGIRKVTLVTRKSPNGLMGAPYFQKHPFPKLKKHEARCVFKGSARAAVKAFPQNVNVSAILSLAGIGPDKTRVEIWTSKVYSKNQHEIVVQSYCGRMRLETHNIPSRENPKTSALAIYSAIALMRKIFSSFRIGT